MGDFPSQVDSQLKPALTGEEREEQERKERERRHVTQNDVRPTHEEKQE